MMADTKVSIIVCTLGRPTLEDCVKSIYNQMYENLELLVVSPNNTAKKILSEFKSPKFGNIKFLTSDKTNVSRQRNIGIRHASGKIIGFIDDDAVADKNWISHLIKHYDDKRVMCVGGKIFPKFLGDIPDELKKLPKEAFKGFLGETFLESEIPLVIDRPLLWGSNISFRKEIFEIIGLFDENLGKTSDKLLCEEEIDMQTRVLESGYKIIYEPKSFVTHFISREKLTKDYFIKRSFWQGYSEAIKIRKYGKFQKALGSLKLAQLEHANNIKLLELFFELSSAPNFETSVNTSYELGRIMGLSSLIKR